MAGILGVAGPSQPLGWLANNAPPLAFAALANDRPAGSAQPAIPLTFLVRSDWRGAMQTVLDNLHRQGCALPISSPPVITLPGAVPGGLPPADVLPYLGRTLDLAAGAALVDPATDPLALIRATASSAPFQVAARVLSAGPVTVPPALYDALVCTAAACTPTPQPLGAYVPLAPVLANAGFYPASPPPQPASLGSTSWARFTNVTGLVAGATKLGDELSLLYSWSQIINSSFASMVTWVWNGTGFAAS